MTKATHTPGQPWAWDGMALKDANGDTILQVNSFFAPANAKGETIDAIHLIAAAPAMLAALQRLVEWIDCGCDPSDKSVEAARAAIAAATGTPTGEGGHPIPAAQHGEGGQ